MDIYLKINFCEAKITPVQTWNNHLPCTYLFSKAWHELITFVKIFQSWVTCDLTVRCYCMVIQQKCPLLKLIEQKMQLASGINDLV